MADRPTDLPCYVVRDLLPLHAEGLLSASTEALVRQHLAGCPACRDLAAAPAIVSAAALGASAPGEAEEAPVARHRTPFLVRVRNALLWAGAALTAVALLTGAGLTVLAVDAFAPPHVYSSLDLYLKDNLPGYQDALSLGQAASLHISRDLSGTTRLTLLGYWPTATGTDLVAEVTPIGSSQGGLLDPFLMRVSLHGGSGPAYTTSPNDTHWLQGGGAAMSFFLPTAVGIDRPTRRPPTDITVTVLRVAQLPTTTVLPAYPAEGGAPIQAVQGFSPVSLSFRVPASIYHPVTLLHITDPVRYAMGRRWLEFTTLTMTSTGTKITGKVHLLSGDQYFSPDFVGPGPYGVSGGGYGMTNPPSGAGTHPFTLTFSGVPTARPTSASQAQWLLDGMSVTRTSAVHVTVHLPVGKGEALWRRGGYKLRLLFLSPRGATVELRGPAPKAEQLRGQGPLGWLFGVTVYNGQGESLLVRPSIRLAGRTLNLFGGGGESATPKYTIWTTTISWHPTLSLPQAAQVLSRALEVQTNMFLPVAGGEQIWPNAR